MQSRLTTSFAIMVQPPPCDRSSSLPAAQSLIARAKMGEAGAFEEILIRYQRQVLGTAVRLLGNIDDASDAAQEVFLRLYKYLHKFDEEKEFLPWLYRMTVNVCHDISRKRGPIVSVSLEQEQESGALDNLASRHDIESEIAVAQERSRLVEALATLSEKERAAIVLRDIEGLETKEVARLLGTSQATVRSQISQARVKIKKYLDRVLKRS